MGKKYLDTKETSLESSILGVWAEAAKKVAETNKNDKSDDGKGLDAVQPKAVKKKFDDRKDKDIDNDGDTDSSDEFLHKKRKAISKAMKDEGNAFGMALKAAKDKGEKTMSKKQLRSLLLLRTSPLWKSVQTVIVNMLLTLLPARLTLSGYRPVTSRLLQ
jgi:hypothetical protein